MPNLLAYVVLAAWPAVVVLLFGLVGPVRALSVAVVAAYLLLPVRTTFDFPFLPPLDKDAVSNLAALVCCLAFVRERWRLVPRDGGVVLLALVYVLSPFATAMTNRLPVVRPTGTLPALTLYDGLGAATANLITLVPFLLGYGLLSTPGRRLQLLRVLVVAALAYSLPMLLEVRISPQLHRIVYGFMPFSFNQQVRMDGYRPVVFLGHGLLVATFCAMALVAAVALWRSRIRVFGLPRLAPVAFLAVLLLLCKSVGALVLAAVVGTAVALFRPRRVALACALVMLLVAVYPLPRAAGWIPLGTISRVASSFSADRAQSLQVRIDNEDVLLARAARQPLFGWGSWGRNRPSNEEAGIEVFTDGTWIIAIGSWGWVGYLAMFGLLSAPALKLLRHRRRLRSVSTVDAALLAVLTLNLLDLIPNSSLRPITWLIAGALCSVVAVRGARPAHPRSIDWEESIPPTFA